MADRGFTTHDGVALKQAKLLIPAFTKAKELDPKFKSIAKLIVLFKEVKLLLVQVTRRVIFHWLSETK